MEVFHLFADGILPSALAGVRVRGLGSLRPDRIAVSEDLPCSPREIVRHTTGGMGNDIWSCICIQPRAPLFVHIIEQAGALPAASPRSSCRGDHGRVRYHRWSLAACPD